MSLSAFPRIRIQTQHRPRTLAQQWRWSVPYRVPKQKQARWCWAAIGASISNFLGDPRGLSQCDVAGIVSGLTCCPAGANPNCNKDAYLERVLHSLGHLRDWGQGWLKPAMVVAEIERDRPVPIRIAFGRSGHFAVICALRPSGDDVVLLVSDPIYGNNPIQGRLLVGGGYLSRGGSWSHSYMVKL